MSASGPSGPLVYDMVTIRIGNSLCRTASSAFIFWWIFHTDKYTKDEIDHYTCIYFEGSHVEISR